MQFRIEAGHLKISTFLDEINIPFSANYYRDVEAGRKYLSIDAAVELHDHLGIDAASKVSFDYFGITSETCCPLTSTRCYLAKASR